MALLMSSLWIVCLHAKFSAVSISASKYNQSLVRFIVCSVNVFILKRLTIVIVITVIAIFCIGSLHKYVLYAMVMQHEITFLTYWLIPGARQMFGLEAH